MKGRLAAFDVTPHLRRAALLIDGRLEAVEIDRLEDTTPQVEAIYSCKITDTMPGINAAFADMGAGLSGFFPRADGLSPGQIVTAQVRREAEGDKLPRLSVDLQFAGRHLIHTPDAPGVNASKKIDEAERARLKAIIDPIAQGAGFVIRTSAKGIPADDLVFEAKHLLSRAESLVRTGGTGLKLSPPNAFMRLLRTPLSEGASLHATNDASQMLAEHNHQRTDPTLFDDLDIESQLDAALTPHTPLREGWIAIEPTAALIAIDVNTGEARGGDAALRVNLDAACAIPRALALRKLGGTVMIDFAGGPTGQARKRLERALMAESRPRLDDPRLLGWGPAGLLEFRCARPGRPLAALLKGPKS